MVLSTPREENRFQVPVLGRQILLAQFPTQRKKYRMFYALFFPEEVSFPMDDYTKWRQQTQDGTIGELIERILAARPLVEPSHDMKARMEERLSLENKEGPPPVKRADP